MTWNHMRNEVEAHIEERALDLIESGLPERDAWAQARREFGNTTLTIERSREVWGWSWLEQLGRDLRYAFRAMAANRLFTALAVASLALGIGANTAIYSFMESILLRSLPVKDPRSLAILKFQRPKSRDGSARGRWSNGNMSMQITSGGSFDGVYSVFPYPAFEIFEKRTDLFDGVFSYHGQPESRITLNGGSMLSDTVYVSGGYFPTLGTNAALGRTLLPEDDRIGAPAVANVSLGLARQWFGDEHQALGKSVGINGVSFTIVGVTPQRFFGANPEVSSDVYLPLHSFLLTQAPGFTEGGKIFTTQATYWLDTMVRLKRGVSREQVQAALDPVFAEYFRQASGDTPEKARMIVIDGARGLDSLSHEYGQPLYVLMAMVALILTIACANIANLLLARASSRKRELAVRLSLGASRGRVIRQLLTESVVLSLMGALLGLLFAKWGMQALTAMLAMGRQGFTLRAELNWPVLAATAAVSLLSAVAFGLAPAWRSTKLDVFSSLRASQSSPGDPKRRWIPFNLGQALIVAQIALSFLLLMGAGLFVRTLSKLQSIELGFNPNNLLIFEINTQQAGYKHAASIAFHEQLRQKFLAIPGVASATVAAGGQLDGGSWVLDFTVPGSLFPEALSADKKETLMLPVGPAYLATMQIPMLAGRDIAIEDQARASTPAVVSESFAKKHFGSAGAAVGRHLSMKFDGDPDLEIVGVAKDARYPDLKKPMPAMLYVDYRHQPGFTSQFMRVVLRTKGDPAQTATAAREILRQTDPGVPMGMMYTQQMTIDSTIIQEILFARLCAVFAALALIIACVGLYGTTAYSVSCRTSEIGIRMALGAQRKTVLAMVLREVAILGVAGLAIGVPIALGMSSLVESFLYKVQPRDPLVIAAAITAMLLGALLAAYVPAQRASRVDPMTALRHE